jgi:hypothetical protein
MKFVTVMDMWLLIINLGLMGSILYYGRKLVNLIARATNQNDRVLIKRERDWFIAMLKEERDSLNVIDLDGNRPFENEVDMLNDLIEKVNDRLKKSKQGEKE